MENENKAELVLRDDNIFEIDRINGQSFQINLNQIYLIMLQKGKELMTILFNGMKQIQIPMEFYDGIVAGFKASKLFEIHKQNYYHIVKSNPSDPKSKMEKDHIDDLFVNIRSKDILVISEEPKYTEEDSEKFEIDVVNKGMLFFFKEENNG